ncbi:hypothetical protein G6F31_020139 [Rhizopus arrhizus]|nr:hypothetical protein G6F31_020139 [Rhizopus arrhizus]
MLVVDGCVGQAIGLEHRRRAAFGGGGFQPRVQDHAIGRGHAHHGGQHEQAVLEGQRAVPLIGAVIAIHEGVRACLQLGENAACRVELCAARAAARDDTCDRSSRVRKCCIDP